MNIHKPASEILLPNESLAARLGVDASLVEGMRAVGFYTAECRDADGSLIWREDFPNLVTTVGGNFVLDTVLAGSGYTATWYMGLISSASYSAIAAGDTMASHAGWTESAAYSNSARPTAAWNSASGRSKALSTGLVFNINATDTIKGCFMNTVATKSGTTGTLLSAGLFTGGDQPVVTGNTLTVSYSLSV